MPCIRQINLRRFQQASCAPCADDTQNLDSGNKAARPAQVEPWAQIPNAAAGTGCDTLEPRTGCHVARQKGQDRDYSKLAVDIANCCCAASSFFCCDENYKRVMKDNRIQANCRRGNAVARASKAADPHEEPVTKTGVERNEGVLTLCGKAGARHKMP
jgi:hypothetical protein